VITDLSIGAATTEDIIELEWGALVTNVETGGSAILSYSLEWDQGGGGLSYVALSGQDQDSLIVE
jgi:hypothetical protein